LEGGINLSTFWAKPGGLANYYLAHSARPDMYRRLGRTSEARSSYEKAGTDPTGTRAAIPARADSAVEIKTDSFRSMPQRSSGVA